MEKQLKLCVIQPNFKIFLYTVPLHTTLNNCEPNYPQYADCLSRPIENAKKMKESEADVTS